jgi:hypothetical protein
MSADPAGEAVEPAGRRRLPRWVRWSNAFLILLATGIGLGVFSVIIGAFWLVTASAYLIAVACFGFAVKAASEALAGARQPEQGG